MLLDSTERTIEQSDSPLAFVEEGGGPWERWHRFLTINGRKAYYLGNVCGTCRFLFERMEGANRSVNPYEITDALNAGVVTLDPAFVDGLEKIIPAGEYRVLLSRVRPRLVTPGDRNDYFTHEQVARWGIDGFWRLPHFPKTEYYRLMTRDLPDRRVAFEFLIPMFPHGWLQTERVAWTVAELERGRAPTALALSVLDKKGFDDWDPEPDIVTHLCLAHYLIDGHHKTYAAATSGNAITMVSFLAVDQGVSTKEDVDDFLRLM